MMLIKRVVLAVFLSCVTLAAVAAPVDINHADAQAIAASLNGVGEAKAAAIVAYRNEHGAFKNVDELTQVKGIGERTVQRNRADITLGK